jgi:hypothetical protein
MPGYRDSQFVKLFGLAEANRQMKELPKEAIEAFGDAAFMTAKLVAVRAASKAPIRQKPLGGYRGGALRQHIGAWQNKATGEARVGIMKGLLVVRANGHTTAIARERYANRSLIVVKGPRKGMYVKTGPKVLLKLSERERVRHDAGVIIQPTKYGHFSELGGGGRTGTGAARPWLAPAVEQSTDYFLMQMRRAADQSAEHLAAMGYQR